MKNTLIIVFFVIATLGIGFASFALKSDPKKLMPANIPEDENPAINAITLTDQLQKPWGLAFLPNGDFLITQKAGSIVRVSAIDHQIHPVAGAPEVLDLGQGGLLDIALSPDFATDRLVFLSFASGTRGKNHTRIARAELHQDALQNLQIIFAAKTDDKRKGLHFGSRLVFDQKGYLFASIGDGFSYLQLAQDLSRHYGKIIRINRDGSIPKDNPFIGDDDHAPEIWSYGHRNPQGLTLHPDTGEMWQSEHGPKGGDEINVIIAGHNYGWPAATFGRGYSGRVISEFTELPGMTSPVLHWTPSIAPSGLAFYSGDKIPQWRGDLFSGALAGKHLRRIKLDGTHVIYQQEILPELEERIRDVRSGPDGYLYVLTDSGKLLRLEPA